MFAPAKHYRDPQRAPHLIIRRSPRIERHWPYARVPPREDIADENRIAVDNAWSVNEDALRLLKLVLPGRKQRRYLLLQHRLVVPTQA